MTMIDAGAGDRLRCGGRPVWNEVERGFWVGSTSGEFLGTIERHGAERYFARDAARRDVGEYASLPLARAAVVERTG